MADPFAELGDLVARWPSYPTGQDAYAYMLLRDASTMIRERWPDVDDRIESGALQAESLARIVVAMVRTAMLNEDSAGLESHGLTAGTLGETLKFANPNGSLYFTAEMVRLLDGYGAATARVGWLC